MARIPGYIIFHSCIPTSLLSREMISLLFCWQYVKQKTNHLCCTTYNLAVGKNHSESTWWWGKNGILWIIKQKKGLIVLIYLITETWRFPQVFPVTKLLSPESISKWCQNQASGRARAPLCNKICGCEHLRAPVLFFFDQDHGARRGRGRGDQGSCEDRGKHLHLLYRYENLLRPSISRHIFSIILINRCWCVRSPICIQKGKLSN